MRRATQSVVSLWGRARSRPKTAWFWSAALAAAGLSLAAALAGLSVRIGVSTSPTFKAAAEATARNTRIAFFEDRVRKDPIDLLSFNTLAGEYLQRARETGDVSDYERAATAAGRSITAVPDNYGGLVLTAQVANARHDFSAALDLTNRAIPSRPEQAAGYGARGDALVQLGRYDEAGRDFQDMVRLQPDLSAFARLASIAYLKGDLRNATDFWKQALNSAQGLPLENQAWTHVQLATQYFDQGDLAKAESEAQAALKTYPNYVHGLAALGSIRAAQGKYVEAIDLYSRVQELLPQPQYVIALGDVYTVAGRPEDAARQYDLVRAIDGLYRANGINTDLQIALFYANHDIEPATALTLAQNNYDANPGIYAADGLAWAQYRNGSYAQAAMRTEEALRLGTRDATMQYHAGMIYYRLGDAALARRHLEAALAINPHFSLLLAPEAKATLAALERGTKT